MILRLLCSAFLALAALGAQAADSPSFELKGSVAYADTGTSSSQYLLVYSSNEADSGPNIYGRVLGPDGTPLGKDFRVSQQTGEMTKPIVAYNPRTQRFLVVWGRKLDDDNRAEVIGLNVGLDGRILGPEFRISFSDLFDTRPAMAYCRSRDRFLVTWTRGTQYDFDNGISDIYGQFVAGDGSRLQGGNFVIGAAAKNQFKSDVAYNSATDEFLVVWEDQRNQASQDDVYGQLISSAGMLIGSNFLAAGTNDIERRPVVASNSIDGTYLLVWESLVDGRSALFTRTLDASGRPLRDATPLGGGLGGTRNRAAVAYLARQRVFLVVFDNTGFDDVSDGIYGQFVEANGDLREGTIALTTANMKQYRPDVTAARNSFLAIWTDYRDTEVPDGERDVYEYYGRLIGNDMVLSSRWKNPQSR